MLAATLVVILTACLPFPFTGESNDGMTNKLDTAAIAEAVTATSGTISTTTVETSLDGFNTRLYVRPVITTEGLTADELDAVLKVAYEQSRGDVSAIEVRTVDTSDEAVDLGTAATELGIHHVQNINSVTYSTVYLDEAYGE